MSYPTRVDMIRSLVKPQGVYAEIGVFRGDFSRQLMEVLKPQKLVLFDLFAGTMGSGDADGNNYQTTDMTKSMSDLSQIGEPIEVCQGDSSSRLSQYPDSQFDMIQIDGDHSYTGCKKDLEVALHKVKPGGWIMGHDYEMNMQKARNFYTFGVRQAVDEFCQTQGLAIEAKGLDGCVSYAIRRT